jgi:glycosyltransferase involved in cell wall biosynthesis
MRAQVELTNGGTSTGRRLRVAHLLSALRPSGAERMLECSFGLWRDNGIEPVVIGLSDEPHPFASALRGAGYPTVVIPRDCHSLGALAALRSALIALRPDVVHVHIESMFPLVCALCRTTPGVRGVVRSIHAEFVYRGLLAPRRILFSRVTAALGVGSVACGTAVADNEERRYRHRPSIVENWVNVAAFNHDLPARVPAARAELGLSPDDFIVMLLGNCAPGKRHSLVLQAISDMSPPVVVLHVGGEEEADEAERASWEGMEPRHRLIRLGRCEEVETLLAASDVLAMPSEREGFPLAAAESLCAGTPVIASMAPGLAWVRDFQTGCAVPLEVSTWASELEQVWRRRADEEWVRACWDDAEAARRRFSPARGVTEWCRLYDLAVHTQRS